MNNSEHDDHCEPELNLTFETTSDDSDLDLELNCSDIVIEEDDIIIAVPCENRTTDVNSIRNSTDAHQTEKNNEASILGCFKGLCKTILLHNIFPDDCNEITFGRSKIQVADSVEAIRCIKFVFCTVWMIGIWHWSVKLFGFEYDSSYNLSKFYSFDLGPVVLDCILFSIIGRIFERTGVDRMAFIVPTMISCIYGSWSSELWFL